MSQNIYPLSQRPVELYMYLIQEFSNAQENPPAYKGKKPTYSLFICTCFVSLLAVFDAACKYKRGPDVCHLTTEKYKASFMSLLEHYTRQV